MAWRNVHQGLGVLPSECVNSERTCHDTRSIPWGGVEGSVCDGLEQCATANLRVLRDIALWHALVQHGAAQICNLMQIQLHKRFVPFGGRRHLGELYYTFGNGAGCLKALFFGAEVAKPRHEPTGLQPGWHVVLDPFRPFVRLRFWPQVFFFLWLGPALVPSPKPQAKLKKRKGEKERANVKTRTSAGAIHGLVLGLDSGLSEGYSTNRSGCCLKTWPCCFGRIISHGMKSS